MLTKFNVGDQARLNSQSPKYLGGGHTLMLVQALDHNPSGRLKYVVSVKGQASPLAERSRLYSYQLEPATLVWDAHRPKRLYIKRCLRYERTRRDVFKALERAGVSPKMENTIASPIQAGVG